MLLEGKNAVIYGGGGSIGGAVAKAFAREGARVFLAGRTKATLDAVAEQIGGAAETAVVDALDEAAVDAHADAIARRDRHLLQRDRPQRRPGDAAGRDDAGRLHGADRDGACAASS